MLHNQSTTQREVVEFSGDVEAVVVARGRAEARPIVTFLQEQGINAQLFNDADAAFEEVLIHRPHVVLVHDDVPPHGGIELCERIKRNTRTHFVPAILFSGAVDADRRLQALEAGVDAIFEPETDLRERRTRLWALLRTQAIYRRQETKQQSQGTEIQDKRRWFGAFVHDLQNSIAALRANFEYLAQAASDPASVNTQETEECVRDGEAIFRELVRGFRTVLAYDRLEAGKLGVQLGPVRLNDLVSAVKNDLALQARTSGKSIVVEVSGQKESPIRGDRELIKHALENLVGHALRQKRVHAVTVKVDSAGAFARVTVTGDGPLTPLGESADALFDPYARSSGGVREGHGLGLALAKLVAELHDGALHLKSGEGGTSFTFELKSEESPPKLRSVE